MTLLDETTVAGFGERLKQIGPDSRPHWGSMRPEILMPHMRTLIEISLEERSEPDVPMPLARTAPFRWGVLYLPWPKGKLKAPDTFFPAPEADFDGEREKLVAAMGRFAEALKRDPRRKTRSPLLGPITLHDWARIHGKHLNHHLEQFGAGAK